MAAWWDSLGLLGQVFATVAIPSTVLLLLQTILLLFSFGGGDSDISGDTDAPDSDGGDVSEQDDGHGGVRDSGLRIFTVRGFVTFFTIFGWAGVLFTRWGWGSAPSVFVASVLGFIFMVMVAAAFAWFLKLQSDGTMNIGSAVGSSATVYLTIPPSRTGQGKVNAIVSGRFTELSAVTDETAPLTTGSPVTVIGVMGQDTLIVIKK